MQGDVKSQTLWFKVTEQITDSTVNINVQTEKVVTIARNIIDIICEEVTNTKQKEKCLDRIKSELKSITLDAENINEQD